MSPHKEKTTTVRPDAATRMRPARLASHEMPALLSIPPIHSPTHPFAAQASDRRLPLGHRQAMAAHLGQVYGNHAVQRMMAGVQRQESTEGAGGGSAGPVEQPTTSPAAPDSAASVPEMDAPKAMNILMATLLGSVKAMEKFKHKVALDRKIGSYATLKSVAVGLAGELSVSAKGSPVILTTGSGGSTTTKSTMQEYGRRKTALDKQGQATVGEIGVKLTDTVNNLFNVELKDAYIKWISESLDEKEIKGTVDIAGKADNGLLAGLKLDVYNLNLEDPTKSTAGAVTPYAGWEGSLPLISVQIPPLDWITFPAIEVAGKAKVTGEAEIQPNIPAILLELAKRFGPKIAERVALATGSKAAGPIAARIVGAAKNVFSIPGAMAAAGVMSVLTFIDAFMEGDRIRNLGMLAQQLALVYAGAYVAEWNGQGGSPGGSPGGEGPITAHFAAAGQEVALRNKQDVLQKVMQQAVQEELPIDGQAAEIWKQAVQDEIKNNPAGIGDIVPAAQGYVNQYILEKWAKGREEAWTRKGMDMMLGVFGMGVGEVKGSAEYEKFKGDYLKAYTTDRAYQIAIEQAVSDMEREGKPVTPENVNEALYGYFTKKAQETEQELQ